MKNINALRNIVGVLLVAACGYFLGCEPNELISSLPSGSNSSPNDLGEAFLPPNPATQGEQNYGGGANPQATNGGQFVSNRQPTASALGLPPRNGQTILIASFNIQVLGQSKMSKPPLPERIAEIIRQFDVVAIQEIRDRTQQTIPKLMEYININGHQYNYLISEPLGRTTSKEQYCFIYNTKTIVGSPDATYIVDDSRDLLHREPFVARFVTRLPVNYQPFTFTLVNIHTDPDEVAMEIPVMHTVLRSIREFEYVHAREDDVLLMGDLNVPPNKFGQLGQIPGITWTVQSGYTNTAKTKILDNILFDQALTAEFTRQSGVLDLENMFRISREEAQQISDHLPVWAEFSVLEQSSGFQPQLAAEDRGLSQR